VENGEAVYVPIVLTKRIVGMVYLRYRLGDERGGPFVSMRGFEMIGTVAG